MRQEPYEAPFRSTVMTVKPDWIDYNGHLNMAYYNVLFDTAVDQAFLAIGLGPDYVRTRGASYFTAEAHVCYLRELHEGDPVVASVQVLDWDDKRLHVFQELCHADDGFLSATSEQLLLHVDMTARKVAPWPDDIRAALAAMAAHHAVLDRPRRAGRSIGIARKA
ncbi:thioesterase family protein [Polymorphum gilvum]|uniref:Thioesterase superfamily protein n=1 Tax=Polymorphum gilvum (strain LMG 25793 / CGMCC 1.9160 / SL003B-26A1) TaxID=991905 RepID=F2J297_POLGS|nr:thioesterase family protein [Polymorphum gilvum]ADZ69793.1 Thioesterase superfamily protein [Polymorphum gilvum SL003B-26A1]